MLGLTKQGYCWREQMLMGPGDPPGPCQLRMKDGKICGDSGLYGPRCCYSRETSPGLERRGLVLIEYVEANERYSI